ncbi:MAG: MgtC/SapB family protein [Candidatus Hydrogenedentales bacterium]|jgi:putative Mg2+ transporter-C (MgtC) family protein
MDTLDTIYQILGNYHSEENILEIFIKLLLALFLSGIIGIERQRKGRSAGLRTHILVCLGSTLLMMISEYFYREGGGDAASLDRARLAAGIVTGIGFLGAGTIMKSGQEMVGLTTAATIWFAAAQGVAIGAGYLVTALIATGFVLAAVTGLSALNAILPQHGYFFLSIQLPTSETDVGQIVAHIEAAGPFEVFTTAIKEVEESNSIQVDFQVHSRSSRDFSVLAEVLRTRYAHARKITLERLQS